MFFDRLPETVQIGGAKYDINSDFRTSLKFEQILFDSGLSKEDALLQGLGLYYPIRPEDEAEALNKIIWFYMCGETEPGEKKRNEKRIYSAEHDFKYIYSAFLQQYAIDLTEADMHWWKYRALFASLNDCMLQRIMGYRSIDIKKLPLEERKKYRSLQQAFALPDGGLSEEDREFQQGLENALENGTVTEFLGRQRK